MNSPSRLPLQWSGGRFLPRPHPTDHGPVFRDLGYGGPPFTWDEENRRHLRARLDALYFHLYGLDRTDAAYILDTFPIVRREDEAQFDGRYRTKELILGYLDSCSAGDTETSSCFLHRSKR